MLSDELKSTIQNNYSVLLKRKDLQSRGGQKQMIAEIANMLGAIEVDASGARSGEEPGVCVIEAGTGTGKTLAYLVSALPIAQELGKKLVIATATVALQEQVIHKDLPDLRQNADLDFEFVLAKGRGRYLCLAKLDNLLRSNSSQDAMQDLYGLELENPGQPDHALYEKMLDALADESWQGDRDDWPDALEDNQWRLISVDQHQCSGRRCPHYSDCSFFKSRNRLQEADCIVANHDLVLSDLNLGGGVILPAPEDCIYVFDEGHHLPVKGTAHFSHYLRLTATVRWLEHVQGLMPKLAGALGAGSDLTALVEQVADTSGEARTALRETRLLFQSLAEQAERLPGRDNTQRQYVFRGGSVPEEFQVVCQDNKVLFSVINKHLQSLLEAVRKCLEADSGPLSRSEAERWHPLLGAMLNRSEAAESLWRHFGQPEQSGSPPLARWLTWSESGKDEEIAFSCSPVIAAETLDATLWQQAFAVILTSATLSALGNFDFLTLRAGLPEKTRYRRIQSPFDYQGVGLLRVPKTGFDASRNDEHTKAIVRVLPDILKKDKGALILFSSRRQMQDVLWELDKDFREHILCQDDYSKQQLITLHREKIDKGEQSLIFGLASLAEGIDLPGDYCQHVVIAKIPFPVPNDPVDSTLGEWIQSQGKNAFRELSMPEAAMRLIQASGRLLRTEQDVGTITILDDRLVNKPYGRQLLDSLPPYRREIF